MDDSNSMGFLDAQGQVTLQYKIQFDLNKDSFKIEWLSFLLDIDELRR